jgi:hypothetical protein
VDRVKLLATIRRAMEVKMIVMQGEDAARATDSALLDNFVSDGSWVHLAQQLLNFEKQEMWEYVPECVDALAQEAAGAAGMGAPQLMAWLGNAYARVLAAAVAKGYTGHTITSAAGQLEPRLDFTLPNNPGEVMLMDFRGECPLPGESRTAL